MNHDFKAARGLPIDNASERLVALASGEGVAPEHVTPGFVEAARRHGLIGALARSAPSPLVTAIHARDVARRRVMQHHLDQVLTTLHREGIRASPLKGPVIAQAYADPGVRQFSDIDLLVEASGLDRSLEVLRHIPAVSQIPPKRPKADKRDVLLTDESGVHFNLDLHWDLFSYNQIRGAAHGATAEAWDAATLVENDPLGPHWRLPQAHELAFLACHAVLDHRFRLILFRDFAEIARHDVDWEGLLDVARRWGLRSTTYVALNVSRQLLDAGIPQWLLEELRPPSLAVRYLDWSLPKVDLSSFDGHAAHPINLAAVTLNDTRKGRLAQLAKAPTAFPGWRRRVAAEAGEKSVPRVLIVVSSTRRRGAEVFTERLQEALVRRGWVADSIALYGIPEGATSIPALRSEAPERRFDLRVARALRSTIEAHDPDIVIANGGSTLRYSVAATVLTKRKLVYMSIGEPRFWIRSRFSRLVNRLMLRRVDHVFAVSAATKAQTIELEPSLAGKVVTTYTGVPAEMFRPRPTTSGPELRVVMVGSLSPEKDPELALESIATMPDVTLRFVGDGPLRNELERRAGVLQIADRVEFTGSVPDVSEHLDWAHVLLLTSRSEGLPGAILEAGAAGIPIVAVDVGGVSEAVVDGRTGFLVERNPAQLSQAIEKLARSETMRSEMGDAAREHIRARFDMEKVVAGYIESLKRVHR